MFRSAKERPQPTFSIEGCSVDEQWLKGKLPRALSPYIKIIFKEARAYLSMRNIYLTADSRRSMRMLSIS
jgi:hypothetical protein